MPWQLAAGSCVPDLHSHEDLVEEDSMLSNAQAKLMYRYMECTAAKGHDVDPDPSPIRTPRYVAWIPEKFPIRLDPVMESR